MLNKNLLVFLFIVINLSNIKACDVCGCSINGLGVGFLTSSQSNLIGLNWQRSAFKNTSILENDLKDEFHFFELSIQYFFTKNFRVNVYQPYRLNIRQLDSQHQQASGMSDTRIMFSHILLRNKATGKNSQIFLDAGIGTKLPTGKYNPDIHDNNLPENFNVGTGSFAMLLNSNLTWAYKNIGIAWQSNFQYHFKSTSDYRFGHQLSNQLQGFWEKSLSSKIKIIPGTGIRSEWIGVDKYANNTNVHGTGGQGLYSMVSINLKSNNWLTNLSYLQPIAQKYGGGEIRALGRFSCQFSFLF